jgi:Tol biopolymer transport system component
MALTAGARLGPYEIVSLIGAGGMGEVYKARDTRLGRDVAVKVLPASFTVDPERLRRFEQEARAVAALSHSGILAVYDIGQHDGTPYLVSELLEGESLRELLVRGPLSHRKAIAYAIQIAQGLAAAHSKDIAHRDLKPDNLFITRDGRVKILDFGLAKTIEKRGGQIAGQIASQSDATVTVQGTATDAGLVMGTVGYMSPEQVRGAAVDCRTDIFSFGAVLYEMLTGQRAFRRNTAAETMTAILNDDPPELQQSAQPVPPALERTVRHCLEKSPDQRFQSARDLAFDLESLTSLTGSGGVAAAKGKVTRIWWYVAALALVVLVGAIAGWKLIPGAHPVMGSQFHQVTYRQGMFNTSRYAPDGKAIYYSAAWQGSTPQIYTVAADGVGGHPVGVENARLLAVSKQGVLAIALSPQNVAALLQPGTLARSTNEGAPKPEIENIEAADFTPDGSALAIVRYLPDKPICQLEYPIGKVLYTAPAVDDVRFSPDGKNLAFMTHADPTDDRGTIVILRTSGEKVAESQMYDSLQGLAWNPSGNEVWFTSPLESGAIRTLSLSGKSREPLSVAGRLFLNDISASGQLLVNQGLVRRGMIVSSADSRVQHDVSWLDFGYLRDLSDDGKMVLFEEEGSESASYAVYVRATDGSPAVPIGEGYGLALSKDKKWALADKLTEPVHEVWLLPVGAGEPKRLSPSRLTPSIAATFLPDGKRVVYVAQEAGRPARSWIQDVNGSEPRAVTAEGTVGFLVSPDGKWLLAGTAPSDGLAPTLLMPVDGGTTEPIVGLKPNNRVLGWTSDGQLFVGSRIGETTAFHIEKMNPHTGARSPWHDFAAPTMAGIRVDNFMITPDGMAYGYDYRLGLSDLYTVNGVF